jgi:SAM-dependent methyltransferase
LRQLEGVMALEDAGHLYICHRCGLHFRYPYPDGPALLRAYAGMDADVWAYHERPDYHLARQALLRHCRQGRVLDVGCFRGDFLDALPGAYTRYGVEPSPEAAQVARGRDINMIAKTIEQLDTAGTRFDAVTMLDVIEHLPQPAQALGTLVDLLVPGGVLIVATGNRDALPWRLLRLDYWYYFPEHVSFFNRHWFDWLARRLGLDVLSMLKFSHFEATFSVRMRQLLEAVVYRVAHAARPRSVHGRIIRSIYPFSRAALWREPPKTRAWRDHMLIVLRKKPST